MSLRRLATLVWILAAVSAGWPSTTLAEDINCANEFRSGKLYFSQGIYDKSVEHFRLAVEVCPDKADYRARFAMALAQRGEEMLKEDLILAQTPEKKAAIVDSIKVIYELAGEEFDASAAVDDSKSNLKFVRENRQYFWANRYNSGLKLADEGEDAAAVREFELALLIDPEGTLLSKDSKSTNNSKAYNAGAVSLINDNRRAEAAEWVKKGLEAEPEHEKLNKLLEMIFVDVASDLRMEAEAEGDAAKAEESVGYYTAVLERRGGEDAAILFDRGSAYLAWGRALQGSEGSDQANEPFLLAAADFGASATLTPADEDVGNHLAALFNQAQAYLNAGDFEKARVVVITYLGVDCVDPAIWLMIAQTLKARNEESNRVLTALHISNSLNPNKGGTEIAVGDAVQNATGDAAAALTELGEPEYVHSYQQEETQEQLDTWFWCGKRLVRTYILGEEVGSFDW